MENTMLREYCEILKRINAKNAKIKLLLCERRKNTQNMQHMKNKKYLAPNRKDNTYSLLPQNGKFAAFDTPTRWHYYGGWYKTYTRWK